MEGTSISRARDPGTIIADDPQRATRAIIMMVDNALIVLSQAGWNRRRDKIEIRDSENALPISVWIGKRKVFVVDIELREGVPGIRGKWLVRRFPRPPLFKRMWRWLLRKISREDARAS